MDCFSKCNLMAIEDCFLFDIDYKNEPVLI